MKLCLSLRFLRPLPLLQYWSSLGIADGTQVLEDLGLSVDAEILDLRILSQRLNEEIAQALDILRYGSLLTEFGNILSFLLPLRYPSLCAAITTLLDEVMIVRNNVDNLTEERNKYRSDIQVMQEICRQIV